MKLIKDLGLRYPKETSKQQKRYGIYECPKCGNHVEAQTYKVNAGQSQCNSCARRLGRKRKTHGMTGTRIFTVHTNMLQRCYNRNHKDYENYGKRGIDVCEEWKDAKKFIEWALSNGYEETLTIDRIDTTRGYSPDNCRFVDRKAQAQNRRKREDLKSRYIGVQIEKSTGKHKARIMISGERITIGHYKTDIEAAIARDRYILDNGLKYPRLNILKRIEQCVK